jgi:hypothetical protein
MLLCRLVESTSSELMTITTRSRAHAQQQEAQTLTGNEHGHDIMMEDDGSGAQAMSATRASHSHSQGAGGPDTEMRDADETARTSTHDAARPDDDGKARRRGHHQQQQEHQPHGHDTHMQSARGNPVVKLTVKLLHTYQEINEKYYAKHRSHCNDGYDDENGDYIIRQGDIIHERYAKSARL